MLFFVLIFIVVMLMHVVCHMLKIAPAAAGLLCSALITSDQRAATSDAGRCVLCIVILLCPRPNGSQSKSR